jgi:adenylosuccinate synthase
LHDFPTSLNVLAACKPIYESLPGWTEDISEIKRMEDLPPNARQYLARVAELARTPIQIVSLGPEREKTIVNTNPFSA